MARTKNKFIGVFSHDGDILNGRNQSIRDTWAPLASVYANMKFFIGGGTLELQKDEIRLPNREGKDFIYQALDMFQISLTDGYEHFLIVDTDTYVNVFEMFQTDFIDYDYTGTLVGKLGELYGDTNLYSFMQGHAVWYSRKALEFVVNELVETANRLMPIATGVDIQATLHAPDVWTGQVLAPKYLNSLITIKDDSRYSHGPLTYHAPEARKRDVPTWMRELHRQIIQETK